MKTLYCFFFTSIVSCLLFAQAPQIVWDKTIGGVGPDGSPNIIATNDGGFIIAGTSSTSSVSGDKSEVSRGGMDYWIVKFNSNGQKVWDKTIGGNNNDMASDIIATNDGGFLIAGWSESGISGDKSEASRGGTDYWIVKINSNGQKVWDKTLGGNSDDQKPKMITANDGGFIIVGESEFSISGDKSEASISGWDYWIVKINSNGQKAWDRTIGGSGSDVNPTIVAANDGGFVVAGSSNSDISGDKTGASKGKSDYWIVKFNSNGQKVWDKTIGGSNDDVSPNIKTTNDGGFIIAGSSTSGMSGDKSEANRGIRDYSHDYWIVKIDSNGQKIWDKTIGGNEDDMFPSVITANDGTFFIAGESDSNKSGDKSENSRGKWDYWIVKLDANRQKIWDKTIGGNDYEFWPTTIAINEGGFLLAGGSLSGISGEKSVVNKGNSDFWIVKITGGGLAITTQPLSLASYCPNTTIQVSYTTNGTTYDSKNEFVIQISDATGNNFVSLKTTSNNNMLSALLPDNLVAGDSYKIRVVSTNPIILGTQQPIKILNIELPTATLSGTQSIFEGQEADLKVNLTGSPPWKLLFDTQTLNISQSPYTITVKPSKTTTYTLKQVTNVCGVGNVSGNAIIAVNPVLGIEPSKFNGNNIQLYPNPTQGTVFVELESIKPQKIVIDIFNSMGQRVGFTTHWLYRPIEKVSISTEGLQSGVYLLQSTFETEKRSIKLIIQK